MAFLANVGWGAGLLGVGLIVLAAQLARKHFGLPLEWFSLIVGGAFVVWGVWDLLKIQLGGAPVAGNFLPMLFIAAGLVLVISALLRKGPQ